MIKLKNQTKNSVTVIWTAKRYLKQFQPESPSNSNIGNPKDKEHGESEAMGGGESAATTEARNAHQANRDLSHEREATLNRQIMEAIARETAKVTIHFQAILNERTTLNLAGSLKVTSRAAGFKVMDPFDWNKDKVIYHDKCGRKRLDTPLKQWKVIQKRLKSHISTTG